MKKIFSFTVHVIIITAACVLLLWGLTEYAGAEEVQKTMDIKNDEGSLSQFAFISGGKGFYKIYSMITTDDLFLWSDLMIMKQRGVTDVDFYINSPGGDAFVGFALCGLINWGQANGFNFRAMASGVIASAAVPVFLSFDNRIALPGTTFMVHEPSSQMQGKASEFRSQNELFDILRNQYFEILMAKTRIKDRKQWEGWERDQEWISYERAIEMGIILSEVKTNE